MVRAMSGCRVIVGLALIALAGAPAAAEESTPTARLLYQRGVGAEACPDTEVLRQMVSMRLGYSPWAEDDPRTVEVELSRERGALVARIALRDPQSGRSGERLLSSRAESCDELASAMVLAICIAVDPLRMALTAETMPESEPATLPATLEIFPETLPETLPESMPERAPESLPESAPVLVEAPTSTPEPGEETGNLRLYAGAGTHLTLGSSPTLALGPKLMVGVRYALFSLDLEGRSEFCAAYSMNSMAFGATGLGSLALVPCVNLWWFQLCGAVALGQLSGVVFDPVPGIESRLALAAGGRLGVEIPIYPWLALRLQGDAMLNIVPVDLSPLWQSPIGAVALGTTALVIYFD
ncbi:MAG: hypothetical protein JXR83_06245 [Deltaproteobacteria bacterium]|nr:hypothetical protein [Deltaproteobacteria bacterium]